MNKVLELEENREKSVFCGNLHFEPQTPENAALAASRPGVPLYEFPQEEQKRLMAEQAAKLTAPLATGAPLACCWAVRALCT